MNIFYEKSFWLLISALVAFLAFFYKMFIDKLELQLKLLREHIEKDIRHDIDCRMKYLPTQKEFEEINKRLSSIEDLKKDLESLKRHENKNSELTRLLLKKLLEKLDIYAKGDPDFLFKIMDYEDKQ